jgi:drug/metabolite transporter (DMT)-like permease
MSDAAPADASSSPAAPGKRTGRKRAAAALVACGVLFSTAGALIEYVDWPPGAIWSVRATIVAITLTLIKRPSWRGFSRLEALAGLALAANAGLFIPANKWASPANAILIQYSSTAWAALLGGLVLGERATRVDWIAIAIAMAGVALCFADQLTLDGLAGNAVALGSGVAIAVHIVLLRKIARSSRSSDPEFRAIISGNVVGALAGAPFLLSADALPASGWAALLALGLIQQTVPGLLYAWAINRVTAVEASLLPIVEPLLSPLWVWLAFSERPSAWVAAGGALIVAGVVLRAVVPKKKPPAS